MAIAKGEARAAKIEGITPAEIERKIRLDVHGRPKPAMRGWIHAVAAPLALAAGIVLICLAHGTGLKWACAVFMTCSLVLFGNSACYHLGDWSPRTTDVLRRIDHMNIFLLIAALIRRSPLHSNRSGAIQSSRACGSVLPWLSSFTSSGSAPHAGFT